MKARENSTPSVYAVIAALTLRAIFFIGSPALADSLLSIGLSATTLSTSVPEGNNAEAYLSFEIWNAGGRSLDYTITSSDGLLTVDPISGNSSGEHQTINLVYWVGGGPHTYFAHLTITAPGAGNSPQQVNVNLGVYAVPGGYCGFTLVSGELRLRGKNTPSQSLEIWNGGVEAYSYTINTPTWLSRSPKSGSFPWDVSYHNTVTVNYANAGLKPGIYYGFINISSGSAQNSPKYIGVKLTFGGANPGLMLLLDE